MSTASINIPQHNDTSEKESHILLKFDTSNAIDKLLSDTHASLPNEIKNINVISFDNIKLGRKALKKNPNSAILLINLSEDLLTPSLEFIRIIRKNLNNHALRIIVIGQPSTAHVEKELIQSHGVNTYRSSDSLTANQLASLITSEIKTFQQFQTTNIRRSAEISLLTSLASFSRMELSLEDCFTEFNKTISIISNAILGNVLLVDESGNINRSDIFYINNNISQQAAENFIKNHKKSVNTSIKKASLEGAMQIYLEPEDSEHKILSTLTDLPIDGSLAFPLKSYNKTLAIVQCYLQKEQLNNISIELINLVEKSSEQLSVLLERQEAEEKLQQQYQRLKSTLTELKNTKSQLYQSEKMASIGQLAAGIAHEINNPLAFIMGNFNPLDEYVESMTNLLKLHNAFIKSLDEKDDNGAKILKDDINSFSQQEDINFILDDVRSLVADSREGLSRVKDIITNLKEFSHADKMEEIEETDLQNCIESTLKILNHQIKHDIELIKDFSALPKIKCNPGLLNQVFMNLIQNAIHATDNKGIIKITTLHDNDKIIIKIRDNGTGIPEEKLSDIFNPFYTTKPVGQGTGLGLSISHNIIEKHGGTISIETEVDKFTEFTITLPMNTAE